MLCPGFVPFSMCNTEALKALEHWEKQQRHSDFHSLSSHQLPTYQIFLTAILVLGVFSPSNNSPLYKAGLPTNAETSGWFFS